MALAVESHSELGKIFDISPLVTSQIALFPGDTAFTLQNVMGFKKGHGFELSALTTSLHIGSHADAPSHFHPKGDTMENRSLNFYIGRAQVVHCRLPIEKGGRRIRPQDLNLASITEPRVLFRTDSYLNPNQWSEDFTAFSPELIEALAKLKVITVGIDTPSVDPAKDEALLSHKAIFAANMANLEGLKLADVPEGVYQLVALPLKIAGAEASPIRAILMEGKL